MTHDRYPDPRPLYTPKGNSLGRGGLPVHTRFERNNVSLTLMSFPYLSTVPLCLLSRQWEGLPTSSKTLPPLQTKLGTSCSSLGSSCLLPSTFIVLAPPRTTHQIIPHPSSLSLLVNNSWMISDLRHDPRDVYIIEWIRSVVRLFHPWLHPWL